MEITGSRMEKTDGDRLILGCKVVCYWTMALNYRSSLELGPLWLHNGSRKASYGISVILFLSPVVSRHTVVIPPGVLPKALYPTTSNLGFGLPDPNIFTGDSQELIHAQELLIISSSFFIHCISLIWHVKLTEDVVAK